MMHIVSKSAGKTIKYITYNYIEVSEQGPASFTLFFMYHCKMYTKKILFSLVVLTALSGGYTADITECPSLTPRSPPSSVHDLRPDDIKVIAALGDRYDIFNKHIQGAYFDNVKFPTSVMAGFGAKDIDISKHLNGQIEYRGVSFAIGGDDGAATLSNYIKYYQPELKGSSRGQHEMRNCDCK